MFKIDGARRSAREVHPQPARQQRFMGLAPTSSALMDSYRHHRASRDVQVIFVEVPAAGSPKPVDVRRPPAYPVNQRSHWRPATRPPSRLSKAEALKRLLDTINRQEQAVRAFMDTARSASQRCDEMIPSV